MDIFFNLLSMTGHWYYCGSGFATINGKLFWEENQERWTNPNSTLYASYEHAVIRTEYVFLCVRCKRFLMCVCDAEVHTSGTVYDSMLQLDYRSFNHYLVLKGRGGFPCLSQVGLCAKQGIVFEILSLKTGCEKSNFITNPLVRTFSQMILLSRNMLSPSASNHSSDS